MAVAGPVGIKGGRCDRALRRPPRCSAPSTRAGRSFWGLAGATLVVSILYPVNYLCSHYRHINNYHQNTGRRQRGPRTSAPREWRVPSSVVGDATPYATPPLMRRYTQTSTPSTSPYGSNSRSAHTHRRA